MEQAIIFILNEQLIKDIKRKIYNLNNSNIN